MILVTIGCFQRCSWTRLNSRNSFNVLGEGNCHSSKHAVTGQDILQQENVHSSHASAMSAKGQLNPSLSEASVSDQIVVFIKLTK